jgi:hypothetical protein
VKQVLIPILLLCLAGCNTFKAAQGNTSSDRVVGGMKQDAKAVGETVQRGAQEIGSAVGKALK